MTEEPGVSVVVEAYRCPHCQAALEDRSGRASLWLRCPNCGRAGRTPEHRGATVRKGATFRDDIVFIDAPSSGRNPIPPVGGVGALPTPRNTDRPGSVWRVVHGASLFVAVTLLLFAILDRNSYGVTVCIGMAIVSLGLLVRSARW